MDYARYIIFPAFENKFDIQIRKENEYIERTYFSIDDCEKDFISGEIHPGDLKPAVAKAINKLL
jgi:tyrosyl-tRNA synthetase